MIDSVGDPSVYLLASVHRHWRPQQIRGQIASRLKAESLWTYRRVPQVGQ